MTHHTLTDSHTLVLFSDQSDGASALASAFAHVHYQVIVVASVAELAALELDGASFVIFDVAPEHLLAALHALRAHPRWGEAVALVRAERLGELESLAGICPSYRALLCHHVDLLTLLKHQAQQAVAPEKPRLL